MPEAPEPADLLTLLESLEARVLADPVLAADHAEQLRRFPAAEGDDHAALRFREWYLLEHAPLALGAPTAVCWAPADPEPGTPWAMLLAARFGVARFHDEGARVEEMWTGRTIELVAPVPGADEDTLLVGWLVPTAVTGIEAPLPGSRILAIPGLRAAFEKDLAQARIESPRSRLSQQACERMLRGLAEAARATGGGAATDPAALAANLESLLVDEPEWDAERALALRAQEGDAALLDRLAFDTAVDLERTRRLLLEHRAAASDPLADALSTTGEGASPAHSAGAATAAEIAAALTAFDAAAGGKSLAERFAALEAALGLEQGITDEGAPLDDEATTTGPEDLPGMPFWIAAWAWECEQLGCPPEREELMVLAEWSDFLGASKDGPMDAADVERRDLLGFLMAAPDGSAYARRRTGAQRFVAWLEDEQQAALDGLAGALEQELGERIAAAVRVNAALAEGRSERKSNHPLVSVSPPQVEGDEGPVEVHGLPNGAAPYAVGDHVLGHWHDGAFHAAAWLPADVLPPAPKD